MIVNIINNNNKNIRNKKMIEIIIYCNYDNVLDYVLIIY